MIVPSIQSTFNRRTKLQPIRLLHCPREGLGHVRLPTKGELWTIIPAWPPHLTRTSPAGHGRPSRGGAVVTAGKGVEFARARSAARASAWRPACAGDPFTLRSWASRSKSPGSPRPRAPRAAACLPLMRGWRRNRTLLPQRRRRHLPAHARRRVAADRVSARH